MLSSSSDLTWAIRKTGKQLWKIIFVNWLIENICRKLCINSNNLFICGTNDEIPLQYLFQQTYAFRELNVSKLSEKLMKPLKKVTTSVVQCMCKLYWRKHNTNRSDFYVKGVQRRQLYSMGLIIECYHCLTSFWINWNPVWKSAGILRETIFVELCTEKAPNFGQNLLKFSKSLSKYHFLKNIHIKHKIKALLFT